MPLFATLMAKLEDQERCMKEMSRRLQTAAKVHDNLGFQPPELS